MAGGRFGKLTVVSRHRDGRRRAYWLCECDCGARAVVSGLHLRQGITKSCGCRRAEHAAQINLRHGQTGSPTYAVWHSMIQRTTDPGHSKWSDYGGRGIGVCARWRTFECFLADMGEQPRGSSIDRIDNDRGYEPDNCRWTTARVQANNRRHENVACLEGVCTGG
jgi:hypothetical protein